MLVTEVKPAKVVDNLPERNALAKDADNRQGPQGSQNGSARRVVGTTNLELLPDYQQILEALGDAVIICDSDGVIRFWNAAAEHLFGFIPSEALGSSLDLIIPERLRERHWAAFTRPMVTGQTRYQHDVLRVPAMHKDGRTLSIAFTVGLLLGPQRGLTGLVAVIRDETKRFAEERDLRKRLAELEGKHGA
jgi:PAS domain S-box-containing protein